MIDLRSFVGKQSKKKHSFPEADDFRETTNNSCVIDDGKICLFRFPTRQLFYKSAPFSRTTGGVQFCESEFKVLLL